VKRSAIVRPDTIVSGVDGQDVLVASREAILDAVIRAVDTMILCGGQFTVSSQRVPTGFDSESVCAAAFVTWMNHPSAKPQPEPHAEVSAVAGPQFEDEGIGPSLPPMTDEEVAEAEADLDEADVEDAIPTAAH
jgi:hypothetical protein